MPHSAALFNLMGELSFRNLPEDTHQCTSFRDGDWIVWRCPLCTGYERRYNANTGEMRIRRGGTEARHSGSMTGEQDLRALTQIRNLN